MLRLNFPNAIKKMRRADVKGDKGLELFVYSYSTEMIRNPATNPFVLSNYPEEAKDSVVGCLDYFGIVYSVKPEKEGRYEIVIEAKAILQNQN